MAKLLTMTLMETGQDVPDFLEQYKPDETDASKLKFEYDTDEDDPDAGNDAWGADGGDGEGGGGGWDAGDDTTAANGNVTGDTVASDGNVTGGDPNGWGAPTGVENAATQAAGNDCWIVGDGWTV
jgi:ATP-dependent RNA helicase DDX3X